MFNNFEDDLVKGDAVVGLLYEEVFLGGTALNFSRGDVALIDFANDARVQYSGADLVVHPGTTNECLVEVKSAVDNAGKSKKSGTCLRTFAQEVSYINARGELRPGWFVDDGKRTDVYAFCWIPEVRDGMKYERGANYYRIQSLSDIEILEVAMVKKSAIDENLCDRFSLPVRGDNAAALREYLLDQANLMRRRGMPWHQIGGLRMCFSRQLKEQPINLLLPKADLREMAFHAYRLSKTSSYDSESRFEWRIVDWQE